MYLSYQISKYIKMFYKTHKFFDYFQFKIIEYFVIEVCEFNIGVDDINYRILVSGYDSHNSFIKMATLNYG